MSAGATPAAARECALVAALALAATLVAHHGSWAGAQAPVEMEMLHAGAPVEPPLVELHVSPEPVALELVASGAGVGAISVSVVRSSSWGAAGAPLPAPVLDDHGGGEVTLTMDRSSPGELVIEATAAGASGGARALYVVRVLDALPPPDGRDGAAPSRIVGHVDPADPALPRILEQAGRPLCAEADPQGMSGVPPIEGTGPDRSHRATFGQQVEQWVHLDAYRGPDRVHYYMKYPDYDAPAMEGYLKSPYTNEEEAFSSFRRLPRAAAPGPYWGDMQHALGGGEVELHYRINGTDALTTVRVNATSSFVPEILPLDGVVRVLATAFHTDGVKFRTSQPAGTPSVPPGLQASANGTLVPAGLVPTGPALEPHHHGPTDVVATVRVSDVARQGGVLIEGITDGEGTEGMEVKRLHEVTLAVELPIGVGDAGLYERVGEGMSVAPWECWPRLGGRALVP